ncbi:unnamed protein product [Penicillium nalgiovense]|nr:unnamed protein product [Penicillium nalgiovense]
MVAEALVNHPLLPHWLRFIATTVARDKVLRTIQYFSRFYAWYLYRLNKPQSAIDPYNAVKKQFATTRKILRIGKFAEHLKAALIALDHKNVADPVLRYLAVGRQLGYAGYLTLDTVTVMDAVGYRKLTGAKRIQEGAHRAWAMGLVCSAAANVYTLFRLQEEENTVDRKEGEGLTEVKKIERQRTATQIQLISDLCDLTVPGATLGFTQIDDGLVGLAGTVSSVIGVWSEWHRAA